MSISQDITLNNSALEKTSSHLSLSRKSLASEEDLFQKFILDKESASMEGEKAVFDQKALDNEEVESNISCRFESRLKHSKALQIRKQLLLPVSLLVM